MVFHKHIPLFPLSNYVESILYVEGNNKGAGFPKTNMSIVFNLNDNFKLYTDGTFSEYVNYKKHWIAGFQTKPTYVESYGESKMIVIQFRTLGAALFLNQPLRDFSNSYVALDQVYKKEADYTWERLKEAETIVEKLNLAENFISENFLQNKKPNEKLLGIVSRSINRNLSIDHICKTYKISRKHLNSLFNENIGITPKSLSSIYRLQKTFKAIGEKKPENLTDFAYQLDYFDQSHFNNDFKRFTNLTPSEYIKNVEIFPELRVIPHFLPFQD